MLLSRCYAPLSNPFLYSFLLPRSSIVSELLVESIVSVVCLLSSQPILRVVTRGPWRLVLRLAFYCILKHGILTNSDEVWIISFGS